MNYKNESVAVLESTLNNYSAGTKYYGQTNWNPADGEIDFSIKVEEIEIDSSEVELKINDTISFKADYDFSNKYNDIEIDDTTNEVKIVEILEKEIFDGLYYYKLKVEGYTEN